MQCALLALSPYPCLADAGVGEKVSAEKDDNRIRLEAELAAVKLAWALEREGRAEAEKPQQVHRATARHQGRREFWESIKTQGHLAFDVYFGGS